ncbi:MAG: XrtA/PEP-CTERM system TPR-repeat protein PrsT [Pseudomonadota bacterium]
MRSDTVAAIAMFAVLSACTPPLSEEALVQRAEEAITRGDLDAALPDIKTALQANPESVRARLLYGKVYLIQQEPESAIDEFERALRAGAGADAQLMLAKALVRGGEAAELLSRADNSEFAAIEDNIEFRAALARAHLAQVEYGAVREVLRSIDSAGNNYVDITKAIVALQLDRDKDSARRILATVVERDPSQAFAWSILGVIAASLGDFDAAGEAYANAATANPYRVIDRVQLVNARLRSGNSNDAESELLRLEQVAPNAPPISFLRGQIAYDEGDYRGALDSLAKVLSVDSNHAGALLLSGLANVQEGNLLAAERQLSHFRDLAPDHLEAGLQLAEVLLDLGEPEKAEVLVQEVLRVHEMNVRALGILAVALSSQGLYAESSSVYQQLAKLEPDSPEALLRAGTARIIAGDRDAGVADLEAAVALDPDNTTVRARLIAAYLIAGQLSEAKSAAQDFAEAAPESPKPWVLLGQVSFQEGDRVGAQSSFERALSLDPGNYAASTGLAAVAYANNDLEGARDVFLEALETEPGHLEMSLSLAFLLNRLEDKDGMREALQNAISANEDAIQPRVLLARLDLEQGRLGDVLALLQPLGESENDPEVLRLLTRTYIANEQAALADDTSRRLLAADSTNPESLAVVAQAEIVNERPARALDMMERAIELSPADTMLRRQYIEILVSVGEFDVAQSQVNLLPDDARGETDVLLLQGRLAVARGEPEVALPFLNQAFTQQPNNLNLVLLSAARWAAGSREAVLAELADWLEEFPGDALIRNTLASRQMLMGDEGSARLEYEKLLSQSPDNVPALNNLAWLLRKSDTPQALEYSERAMDLAPKNVQVLDTYAMVLLESEDVARALDLNTRILEKSPGSPEFRFNRAQILYRAGRSEEAKGLLRKLVAGPVFSSQPDAAALLATLAGG